MISKETFSSVPSHKQMEARLVRTIETRAVKSDIEYKGERILRTAELNRLVSILAKISLNGARSWQDFAACQTSDPDLFFPSEQYTSVNKAQIDKAKAICSTCPAIEHCFNESAKLNFQYGIWAGLTAPQRKKILETRTKEEKKAYRTQRIAAKARKG